MKFNEQKNGKKDFDSLNFISLDYLKLLLKYSSENIKSNDHVLKRFMFNEQKPRENKTVDYNLGK